MYFNASKAILLQRYLSKKVVLKDDYKRISRVVAVDSSFSRKRNKIIAVAVLFEYPSLKMITYRYIIDNVKIPYIPGLLAFREAPYYIKILKKIEYDLILVDGHGIAHPRFLGIAAHIGVVLDKPAIGVAKKRLYGEIKRINGQTLILDKKTNRILGTVIESRGRELYISPGHRVTVSTAAKLIRTMLKGYYLPLPLHIADKLTKEIKRKTFVEKHSEPT